MRPYNIGLGGTILLSGLALAGCGRNDNLDQYIPRGMTLSAVDTTGQQLVIGGRKEKETRENGDISYVGSLNLVDERIKKDVNYSPEIIRRIDLDGPALVVFGRKYFSSKEKRDGIESPCDETLFIYKITDDGLKQVFKQNCDDFTLFRGNGLYIATKYVEGVNTYEDCIAVRTYPPYECLDLYKWEDGRFVYKSGDSGYTADILDVDGDSVPEIVSWSPGYEQEFSVSGIGKGNMNSYAGEMRQAKIELSQFFVTLPTDYEVEEYCRNYKNPAILLAAFRPVLESRQMHPILRKNAWKVNREVMRKALITEYALDQMHPILGIRYILPKPSGMDYVRGADGKMNKIWTPEKPYGWQRHPDGKFSYHPRESRFEDLDDKNIHRDAFGNPLSRGEPQTYPSNRRSLQKNQKIRINVDMKKARENAEKARKAVDEKFKKLRGEKKE